MKKFWKEKKVLVTGATGLVGSWLVRKLIECEAHVVTLIRDSNPQSELFRSGFFKKTDLVQGSLEDFYSVERAINENEVETVFHLGAQTIVGTAWRSPLPTFEANIRGTYNLLEACRRHSSLVKQVIIASSDKAYGTCRELPYNETTPLEGRNPYDVSKTCTDLLASSYFHTYRLPLAIARCGNIYGGGDLNWSRLIPGTIRSFLQNETPILRSDGKFTRDYLFVQDVVEAYMKLAEEIHRPEVIGQAFNFGPNKPYSALEIVEVIQKQMKCEHLDPKILNNATAEIKDQSLDSKKAKEILGWDLKYTLDEGLSQTIRWYEQYFTSEQTVLA
jgi:CDP-glucose 4,6-dehydratase